MVTQKDLINIGMGLDVSGLTSGLKTAKDEMALAQSKFNEMAAGMGSGWTDSIDGIMAKMDTLAQKIEAQKSVVQLWQDELDRVTDLYGADSAKAKQTETKLNNATATLKNMMGEYDEYGTKLANLQTALDNMGDEAVETAGDVDKVGKSLDNMESSSSSLISGGLEKLKNKFIDVAKNGVHQLINSVKQFVKQTIQVGMDFTETMSKVQATSKASAEDMKMLEDTARKYGATTTFSATQAAEALNNMALAGWKADQSASALGGVLSLAASAGMSLDSASSIVTNTLAAFQLDAEKSGQLADVLAYAQSNANTTAEQLGEAYKKVAPTMYGAGQTIETMTALLSAMANQGVTGSEAGTKLNAMMRDLTKKMKDGAIQIGDVSVQIKDAKGNYLDLLTILTRVRNAVKGMGDADKQAALMTTFTSESISALNMILSGGITGLKDFRTSLKNSGGTAQEMSDIMTDNLAGDKKALDSAIEDLQLRLFDLLEGPLRGIMQFLTEAIPVLIEWGEKIYDFFNGIYQALGPLWDALGAVMGFIGDTVGKAFDDMAGKFDKAKEGAGNIADTAKKAYNGIKDAFSGAGKWAEDTYNSITKAFDGAGKWFKDKFDASWNNIKTAFTNPKQWADGVMQNIKTAFDGASGWFKTQFETAWGNVKKAFPDAAKWAEGVWSNIKTAFTDPIGWAKGIASSIRTGLQAGWERASSLLSGAWDSIKTAFGNAFSWASGIAGSIRSGLQSGWEYASNLLSQAWQNVKTAFTDPIGWAKGIASGIRTGLSDGWNTISSTFGGIWDKIKGAFGNPAETFRSMFSGVYNAITGAFGGIKTFFEGIYNTIVGIFKPILKFFGITTEDDPVQKQRDALEAKIKNAQGYYDYYWSLYQKTGKWTYKSLAGDYELEAEQAQADLDYLNAQITGGIGGIKSSISQAFKDIPSILTKPFEDAYKAIKGVFDGIGDWFNKNVVDPIVEAFDSIPDEVVDGLALGLTQGATSSGLGSGISTLAGAVSGGTKDALGIHSPSRVMRDEVGLMVGAGVAEGIRDSIRGVKAASEELAGAVPGRIGEPGIAGAGAGAVTYIQNITSPTPLTAGQIYRDTRSLIGRRGWLA